MYKIGFTSQVTMELLPGYVFLKFRLQDSLSFYWKQQQ